MGGGVKIYVEGVEVKDDSPGQALAVAHISKKQVDFEKLLDVIKQVADEAARGLATLTDRPSEISLEFGLTLGVSAGQPVLAEVSGEGSVKVRLVWKSAEQGTSQDA